MYVEASGVLEFDDLAPGEHGFLLEADGSPPVVVSATVTGGDVKDLGEVRLADFGVVTGRTLDLAGNPIGDVCVCDLDSGSRQLTDGRGAFALRVREGGVARIVGIGRALFFGPVAVDARTPTTSLVLRGSRGALVRGRVRHADGTAVRHESISFRPEADLTRDPRETSCSSDADGRFVHIVGTGRWLVAQGSFFDHTPFESIETVDGAAYDVEWVVPAK